MQWIRGAGLIGLLAAATSACGNADDEHEAPALSGVTAISAGYGSSCAVVTDGSVRCWGSNFSGALGNSGMGPNSNTAMTAVPVQHVNQAVSVAVGGRHACAASSDGTVKCWGQMPDQSRLQSPTIVAFPVDEVTAAQTVVAGIYHSCALLTDATVQCWGNGGIVALGDGLLPTQRVSSPTTAVTVADLDAVTSIAVNSPSTCALRESGEVKCWGEIWGETDSSDATPAGGVLQMYTPTPRVIDGLGSAAAISLGDGYACAVLRDSTVACWGNVRENMGGTTRPSVEPFAVAGLTGATAVAAGDSFACALINDGSISCWGLNLSGELGDGSEVTSPEPVRVLGIDNAIAISAGAARVCALLDDSTVRCWGQDVGGCGDGVCRSSATPVVIRSAP